MDPNANEAVNWITGIGTAGGLGVFIYLVRLFLQRQKESEDAQTSQREKHSQDQKELQTAFTSIVTGMREGFSEDLKETRTLFATQLENVANKFAQQHEAQMKVNTETVVALNGLRDDVKDLKEKVK